VVRELRRIGKRIAIGFDGDLWLVLHLMIAGRLHWRPPNAKLAGRNALAAFDFPNGTLVLTEAGTKRRASLHVLRGAAALEEILHGDLAIPFGVVARAVSNDSASATARVHAAEKIRSNGSSPRLTPAPNPAEEVGLATGVTRSV
jgi:formamidopyrimidine-DNA glycosylase